MTLLVTLECDRCSGCYDWETFNVTAKNYPRAPDFTSAFRRGSCYKEYCVFKYYYNRIVGLKWV